MKLPFQGHSETSERAAVSQVSVAPTKRAIVLRALQTCIGIGMTDDEMQVALRMNPSTQRPRRIELVDMGLVVDSGARRKTRGGEEAVVWRVKTPLELKAAPALPRPSKVRRCPHCGGCL